MANNLYNSMQKHTANPFQQLMTEARNFKKTFNGNPRQVVEQLLNSGQMSQAQFNQYSQIAQQVAQMMGDN